LILSTCGEDRRKKQFKATNNNKTISLHYVR
jgi:hypothetical protein